MKKLGLIAILFFASSALAQGIVCQPNPHASQLGISWDEQRLVLAIENPRGYASMPQADSGLSEEMLPFFKMQVGDLKALGDGFKIQWKRSDCTFSNKGDSLFSCFGSGVLTSLSGAALAIEAQGATSAWITEESLADPQKNYRVRLILKADGNTYFVTLPFPAPFCRRI